MAALNSVARWTGRAQWAPLLIAALAWVSAVGTAGADGVRAALQPGLSAVIPGSDFSLELDVTEAGTPFNAYDAVIEFDPAALTFLPASPMSQQEGSYMTSACGNTFHYFTRAADSLLISHTMVCAGVARTGPGQLYRLHFRAAATLQSTTVRIRHIRFFADGILVAPVYSSNAAVLITTAGVPKTAALPALRVQAVPNPCRSGVAIVIDSAESGAQSVTVYDALGRAVRHLEAGEYGAGTRHIAWNCRTDAGVRLAPGIYRVAVNTPRRAVQARLAVIP